MQQLLWAHRYRSAARDLDCDMLTDAAINALQKSTPGSRMEQAAGPHVLDLFCGALVASSLESAEELLKYNDWLACVSAALSDIEEALPALRYSCDDSRDTTAWMIVDTLRLNGVLDWQFPVGTEVLAILSEDEVR